MSALLAFIRQHRILIAVFVPGLLLAMWELTVPLNTMLIKQPANEVERRDVRRLLFYMESYRALFPHQPDAEAFQGFYALNLKGDWQLAREHFERALQTGVKADQNLLYWYAYVLVKLNEDPAKIDAAIANWRKNFPSSKRTDPRDL